MPRLRLRRCELRHSQSRPMKEFDKTGTRSVFAEKLRQLVAAIRLTSGCVPCVTAPDVRKFYLNAVAGERRDVV